MNAEEVRAQLSKGKYAKLAKSAIRFEHKRLPRHNKSMWHALHPSGKWIPVTRQMLYGKKPQSNRSKVLSALRQIVDYQIAPMRCEGMHVDHVQPFILLVQMWADYYELDWEQLKVTNSRKYKRLSIGQELDKSWSEFHWYEAVLQLIPQKTNLRKSSLSNTLS